MFAGLSRMKELKFTKQTSTVALVFFIAYVIYGIFYTPWVQLLISLAVAGIAYGMILFRERKEKRLKKTSMISMFMFLYLSLLRSLIKKCIYFLRN